MALWGGGELRCYRPDGSLLTSVAVPVERPTSCAFGGPDRTTLFVTTAREGLDRASLDRQPDAGRVFRIDGLGASGPACASYRGRIPAAMTAGRRGRSAPGDEMFIGVIARSPVPGDGRPPGPYLASPGRCVGVSRMEDDGGG